MRGALEDRLTRYCYNGARRTIMTEEHPIKVRVQKDIQLQLVSEPDPAAKVGELVTAHLRKEFSEPGASSKEVIANVCHGAMSAVILVGASLPQSAMNTVQAVGHIVQERSGDPMKTMTYAFEGIARVAPVASRDDIAKITNDIDSQLMGAGQIFSDLVMKQSG